MNYDSLNSYTICDLPDDNIEELCQCDRLTPKPPHEPCPSPKPGPRARNGENGRILPFLFVVAAVSLLIITK